MNAAVVPQQLAQYLAQQAEPFDWARMHCADFVGGWVLAQHGHNPFAGMPRQAGPLSWRRALDAAGGMAEVASAWLRCRPVLPALAQTGDVVMVRLPGVLETALAICNGRHAVGLAAQGGHEFVPMNDAVHCWPLARMARAVPA